MFRDPLWFLALAVPFLPLILKNQTRPALQFPTKQGLEEAAKRSGAWRLSIPWVLRAGALVLVIIALARPQQGLKMTQVTTEGIDISLVVDVSTSMLEEVFT